MLQTSKPILALRSVLRSMGLTKYLVKFLHPGGIEKLEHRLKEIVISRLGPTDIMWDVGANVGLYGFAIAEKCGRVLEFDPDPWCVEQLRKTAPANADIHPIGLSDKRGQLNFEKSLDSSWGNSHLVDDASKVPPERLLRADVWPGDEYRREKNLPVPSAIKIDVEGYELEAVRGLRQTLADPACRTLLVEMHFTVMHSRKVDPEDVRKEVKAAGFTSIIFPDASHLFATKD